jgi:pimeloyl-ACP methyl ester carboxylesterase
VEQGDAAAVPVVLVHGYGDSWRSFERVLEHLPPSVHAFAVSQRGHGASSKPTSGYGVGDNADDLVSFLDAVDVERAVLVASSSATFTVQRVAAATPERVLGLVLIGVPWSLRGVEAAAALADAVAALQDPVDEAFVRDFVGATAGPGVPAVFAETMAGESRLVPARVWKEALAGILAEEPACATARLEAPTLLLWGDRDPFVTREDQERVLAALPRARLVVYPGIGHVVHWERPERVAADLASFAREVVG